MELFRSVGLADKIRDSAVPRDRDINVLWVSSVNAKKAKAHEVFRPSLVESSMG